jgi:hypothetical protein
VGVVNGTMLGVNQQEFSMYKTAKRGRKTRR